MRSHIAAGANQQRNKGRQHHHLLQHTIHRRNHRCGAAIGQQQHHQPHHPAASHGEQIALEIIVLITGLHSASGVEVAGGLLLNHVDDVIDGDDAHQPVFAIDHGQRQKVVALDEPRHLLLIGAGLNPHHITGHHLTDGGLGVGDHQLPQRQDAGQAASRIGDIEGVNGFSRAGLTAHDLQGLGGSGEFLEANELGRHQTTSRFTFVSEQLSGHPALIGAELLQQIAHHLGGQLIKETHPVIRGHLLHQLEHLTGSHALQQRLLHSGFEVLVDLNRLVLRQQAKGDGLLQRGQVADRFSGIHRLLRVEQLLDGVVIAGVDQTLQILGQLRNRGRRIGHWAAAKHPNFMEQT